MVTTEKILQTMNSRQLGELSALCRKICLGASSRSSLRVLLCTELCVEILCYDANYALLLLHSLGNNLVHRQPNI